MIQDTHTHTDTGTHTQIQAHTHTCRCTHIPDASLDSVTSYGGAGFDDVSVCQARAEINLRVKRTGEMRQGGFSINSVIIADVRRGWRGRADAVGKLIACTRFRAGGN